jgi:hypothetical protein
MLISVFGTPSPLTFWGIHVIRAIMHVVCGDYYYVHSVSMDDLRDAWFKRDAKSVLFVSDCPESEMSDLFLQYGAPIFAFADDPSNVLNHLIATGSHDPAMAARLTSRCFCTLSEILKAPSAFRIDGNYYDTCVRSFVMQAVERATGEADINKIEQVMSIVSPGEDAYSTRVGEQILLHFSHKPTSLHFASDSVDDTRQVISKSISQYQPLAVGAPLDQINWPIELFFFGEGSKRSSGSVIELVGPARFLIWGPYMHLPRGNWAARVEIEVVGNHTGSQLIVEVVAGVILATGLANLPAQGIFLLQIEFKVIEPQHAIEVRFSLQSGAIEGEFALRSVNMVSLAGKQV